MTNAFVQEIVKNKMLLIGAVALISLFAGMGISAPSNHIINQDIKYQLNTDNYLVLHQKDGTFDIYQSDKNNAHLTGTYQEYSDRYVLTFSGIPMTQTSYKVENGIQALRADETLGKVWERV